MRLTSIGVSVLFLLGGALSAQTGVPVYRWTTLAGRATAGSEDGVLADARFNQPHGLARDASGNLYVADTGNNTIRKISATGTVSLFAGATGQSGSADGTGSAARFNAPQGLAVDTTGNVYVADTGNHTIRKITPAGVVTTLAGQVGKPGKTDGAATAAQFDSPANLTADAAGNVFLINGGLRKISDGTVQTLALPATVTIPNGPTDAISPMGGVAVDAAGALYFYGNLHDVVKLDSAGNLTVILGNLFNLPGTLFNDVTGKVYLTQNFTNLSYPGKTYEGAPLDASGGPIATTIRFVDSFGSAAEPQGIAVDDTGHWYYTRPSDSAILRDAATFAGVARMSSPVDGTGGAARFGPIVDLAMDEAANVLALEGDSRFGGVVSGTDAFTYSLRVISPTGVVTTDLAPKFVGGITDRPAGLAADDAGNVFIGHLNTLDYEHSIYRISVAGTVTPVAVPGLLDRDKFTADGSGNLWMFTLGGKLWRQPAAGGAWVNIAGTTYGSKDGPGADAQFGELLSLCTDRQGNCYGLDVYDPEHDGVDIQCHVRKITPAGVTSTIGGNLTTGITYPITLAVNSSGTLFFASGNTVMQMDAQGQTTVVGGSATRGTTDGDGGKATFSLPGAITANRDGVLFVVDDSGATLRRGIYLGTTPGITSQPQSQTVAAGDSATFSVTASGDALTYQWYFNGSAFSGGTTSSLKITNVRTSDAGDYTVVVTNAAGNITSNKATLTVSGSGGGGGGNPSNPSGGGGGGGGAPSLWFVSALGALLGCRSLRICFRRAP